MPRFFSSRPHRLPWCLTQDALGALQRFCQPNRPANVRAAARAHCLVAARSKYHDEAARSAPYCLAMDVSGLTAAGRLEPCLQLLSTVNVHRLHLSSRGAPLQLSQLEALAGSLPHGAGAGVRRLVLEADRLGQDFNAGGCSCAPLAQRLLATATCMCHAVQHALQACHTLPSVPSSCLVAAALGAFSCLVQLELRFFTAADLAALPASVRSVTMRAPGTLWALAQVQQAYSRLPQGQRPADWQVVTWLADAAGQQQGVELTAATAAGPAALLAKLPAAPHLLVARTQRLHPAPQPAFVDWCMAFLQRTQLAAPLGRFYVVARLPGWLRKVRLAVEAALVASLALHCALQAVQGGLAARRAATAAVDGRLSFVIAARGALDMGFEHEQVAADLGQLLRASLAALVALGTLRPLVRVSRKAGGEPAVATWDLRWV